MNALIIVEMSYYKERGCVVEISEEVDAGLASFRAVGDALTGQQPQWSAASFRCRYLGLTW